MTTRESTYLTPGAVASMFGVSIETVARWADDGAFGFVRTKGNHRRYIAVEVHAFRRHRFGEAA